MYSRSPSDLSSTWCGVQLVNSELAKPDGLRFVWDTLVDKPPRVAGALAKATARHETWLASSRQMRVQQVSHLISHLTGHSRPSFAHEASQRRCRSASCQPQGCNHEQQA